MSTARRGVGQRGEHLAADFLRQRGYEVLAANLRTPYGELDLLCRDGATLVAVEVKTRRSTAFGLPEEAVTPAKLAHISRAMQHYLQGRADGETAEWRIDVIAVDLSHAGRATAIRLLQAVDGEGG
ncbi:MAG: YraN family protein [Chloroflexota bacterium]